MIPSIISRQSTKQPNTHCTFPPHICPYSSGGEAQKKEIADEPFLSLNLLTTTIHKNPKQNKKNCKFMNRQITEY